VFLYLTFRIGYATLPRVKNLPKIQNDTASGFPLSKEWSMQR